MTDSPIDVPRLELVKTIGFNGTINGGLCIHPDRQHIIYALGQTIIVEDIQKKKQEFLNGHSDNVSCLAVSKQGTYIASGQITHMGFKADIFVWDFKERKPICKFSLHKVRVEALAFSPNENYLLSLGGQDCGRIVIWDILGQAAICGSEAQVESAGNTHCVAYANTSDDTFVSGGEGTLRVWTLDVGNRKIKPIDVQMGQIKRDVVCVQIAEDDQTFYCGTTTGDILGVNMRTQIIQLIGPKKELFSLGVRALALLKNKEMIIGAGDGTVCIVKGDNFKKDAKKIAKVQGGVTSIALRGVGHQFYVGTSNSHIHKFNIAEFKNELVITCHNSAINDICFPKGSSDLFATCSHESIRVWSTGTGNELLRITVPNMTCNAVEFTEDGKSILSGWDDGRIRAFFPESGKEFYRINDAHNLGVTALASTSCNTRIISGGGDGKVRVWNINREYSHKGPCIVTKLFETMKEHKASVSCIKLKKDDSQCVSASTDGTCIIWDLKRFVRSQIIFANTLFKCVAYHPDECQVITSGTDRKIGYWEIYDGSMIRELEGSKTGSINGMDITSDGMKYVTGGDDLLLKVSSYNEGVVTHVGIGHSGPINKLKICPFNRYIGSVSADGACLIWKFPN